MSEVPVPPISSVGAVANSKCEVASLLSYQEIIDAPTEVRKAVRQEKKCPEHGVGQMEHNIFKVRRIMGKT